MVCRGFASKEGPGQGMGQPWASLSAIVECYVPRGTGEGFSLGLFLPQNPRKRGSHWVRDRLRSSEKSRILIYTQFGKVCIMLIYYRSLPPQTIKYQGATANEPSDGGLFSQRMRKQTNTHIKN